MKVAFVKTNYRLYCDFKGCKFVASTRLEKIDHEKEIHGIEYFSCALCDNKEYRSKALVLHQRIKHGPFENSCPFNCDAKFPNLQGKQGHVRGVHVQHKGEVYETDADRGAPIQDFKLCSSDVLEEKIAAYGISNEFKKLTNKFSIIGFDETLHQARWSVHGLIQVDAAQEEYLNDQSYKNDTRVDVNLTRLGVNHFPECANAHLFPIADAKRSIVALEECMTYTNIVIMDKKLNSGGWCSAEHHTRKLIKFGWKFILVINVVVYDEDSLPQLVPGGYKTKKPTGFGKILLLERNHGPPQVISFYFANVPSSDILFHYKSELQNICVKSGVSFLYRISQNLQTPWSHEALSYIRGCTPCHKFFWSEDGLKNHKDVCTRAFFCYQCKTNFLNKDELRDHRKNTHYKYKCSFPGCTTKFTSTYQLNIHGLIHKKIKRYICDICGKRFTAKVTLKAHEVVHTQKKDFRCSRATAEVVLPSSHSTNHSDNNQTKMSDSPKIKPSSSSLSQKSPGSSKTKTPSSTSTQNASGLPKVNSCFTALPQTDDDNDFKPTKPKRMRINK